MYVGQKVRVRRDAVLARMLCRFFLGWMLALALAGCQSLPEFVDSTMKRGQSLYAEKQYDEAIDRFNDVLARDPRYFPAHTWIARAQIAKGAWTPAIASARRAWAVAPGHPEVVPVLAEALFGAGTAALKGGQAHASIPFFLEYIELEPSNPAAYVNVARAYLGEKRLAEALAALSRAIGIPMDPATRREALELLIEGARRALVAGDLPSMIRFLSKYVEIDPANQDVWLDLARGHLKTDDYDGALSAFARGLRQEDGAGRGRLLRALLDAGNEAFASGRWREAAGLLREYVTHERKNIDALLKLARAWWTAGERMQALDALRQVKQVNPRQPEALKYMLGQ